MATETSAGMSAHRRGVTVTTLATLGGIVAAVISHVITGGLTDPTAAATSDQALLVLAAVIVVQLPILKFLGVDIGDFSTKDYLYVAFMTFALWFVSWGILLTTTA
ncbi:MAG: hypothetical protein ABEJ89_10575 [Haloarculaceae archaeon]